MSSSCAGNNTSRKCLDLNHKKLALKAVMTFLQMFFAQTYVIHIIATILMVVDVPVKEIIALLGVGHTYIYTLKNRIMAASTVEDIMSLSQMTSGCGRKLKTVTVFDSIRNEIETGTYTCLREIQKMINDTKGLHGVR